MRLIQFHGSISGRRGWLGPVLVLLAALGAAFVLLVTAFLGVMVLAAGGVARRLKGGPGGPERTGQNAPPSLADRLLKKLFGASVPKPEDPQDQGPRTISMDRGKDGVWRP